MLSPIRSVASNQACKHFTLDSRVDSVYSVLMPKLLTRDESQLITVRLHDETVRLLQREARAAQQKPSRLIRQLVEKAFPFSKSEGK